MTSFVTAPCCAEYAALSRRSLLTGALALAGLSTVVGSAVVTASPARAASARATSTDAVLVVLSLRGAADGLSLVVPHADPAYYSARPRLAIPSAQLLVKDASFGLHPQLAPLLPLWNAGSLAAVHATGLPAPNRSHFAAMEELEDADPGSAARVGWLNRLIGTDSSTSPLQGFNLGGGVVPGSLSGPESVMSAAKVDDVRLAGDDKWDTNNGRKAALHTVWDRDPGPLGRAMRSTFAAAAAFAPVQSTTNNESTYPRTDLGRALSEVSRVIRGDVGVEVITVDQGDWDMHSGLGTLEWGRMRNNANDFASSVAAFFADLGPRGSRVTLVALSEFGRRVRENDSFGLDHGYGNVMFLAGAGVKGGKYYGRWPGLSDAPDADLMVTTDYRSVLSEVVGTRFGASTAAVFPGFQPETVGVMSAL